MALCLYVSVVKILHPRGTEAQSLFQAKLHIPKIQSYFTILLHQVIAEESDGIGPCEIALPGLDNQERIMYWPTANGS